MADKLLDTLKLDLESLVHESRTSLQELKQNLGSLAFYVENTEQARSAAIARIETRLGNLETAVASIATAVAEIRSGQRVEHDRLGGGLAEVHRRLADVEITLLGAVARTKGVSK